MDGVHPFDGVAEHRRVEAPRGQRTAGHGEGAPFPRVVEDGFGGLDVDRSESLHPTQIVDAVHVAIEPQT